MPRLFTAIEVPKEIGMMLASFRGGVHGARWVDPFNYHLTLRFIGDIDDRTAGEVADILDAVERPAFDVTLTALDQFGGLASVMPVFAIFLVVTVLSSAGLPGLNGFVGEYLILLGAWQANPLWAVVGVSGVIFGAVYLLMATRRVLWGPVTQQANRGLSDLDAREVALMLPLVALVFWIGVAPNTFLDKGRGSLELVVNRVREAARVAALETPVDPVAERTR